LEFLVALVVGSLLVGSLLQAVQSLHGSVCRWDRSLRMRQALMASLFRLGGDLRMAGCNPWEAVGVGGLDTDPDGGAWGQTFTVRMDKRGRDPNSWPDGDMNDPDERIDYRWSVGDGVLTRNGQPMLSACEANPSAVPFFCLERQGERGLARVVLNVREQQDARCLAMSVCLRNPMY